jgi:hypothetical protein
VSRGFSPDSLQANENDIASGIEAMQEKLGEASAALGKPGEGDQRAEAIDKARRLARGLESLQERTRERAQGQNGQQQGQQQAGQQGQQGEQGQQGQQGQSGQQGQQGQQGQSGQQGQQAGQGGQGQQGQGQQGQANGQQGQGQAGGGQNNGGGFGGGGQLNNNGFGNGFGNRVGFNGQLTQEDIRQLQAEMRQWSAEAQQLRGLLQGQDIDPSELDALMRAFRQLQDSAVYKDVAELERLQTFVADGMKRFEFNLRRQVDADGNVVVLTGSDEVPESFRKLVEEYYKSLSKGSR